MDRDRALELMESNLKDKNLRKHVLAVAALMRALARRFGEDEDEWELAGLLHDLDYEETKDDPGRHALLAAEWLTDMDVSGDVVHAVKAHADKAPRESLMDKAIYCADPVTGFLVACALIRPENSLAPVDVEFALKRMKEKRFAAGADRDRIRACEDMGLSLEQFLEISINAMKGIRDELGL